MNFATKELTPDQTNALVKNLMSQMGVNDPAEAIRRINTGEWVVTQVKPTVTNFPIWKTVTVGNLSNALTARKQLKAAGIKISVWVNDTLDQITFEKTKTSLSLVKASVRELGLINGATTAAINAAAERHGLSLCPAEAALQLWLDYPDLLACGADVKMAMKPVWGPSVSCNIGFRPTHSNSGRWLCLYEGHRDRRWYDSCCWVFVRK